MISKPKHQNLSMAYFRWKIVSACLLFAGIIFLIEALTRLDLKAFEGLKFLELSYVVPFVACLSCWCAYMAKGKGYSKAALRWLTLSIILLSITLMFLFEKTAKIGSDPFWAFNVMTLALTSSLLCFISDICSSYADDHMEVSE